MAVSAATTAALAVTTATAGPAAPQTPHLVAGSEVLATEQAGTTGLSTLQLRDVNGRLISTLDKRHHVQRRPAVSPLDGTVAVSIALDQEGGHYGLATVSTAGDVHVLTRPRYADLDPSWRRDGQMLAAVRTNGFFNSNHCCQLITVDAGGKVTPVKGASGVVLDPAWSPDGKSIVYTAPHGVWTIPATGGKRRLMSGGYGFSDPQYSPDGKRIIFVQRITPGYQRLIMVNVGDLKLHLLGIWPNAVESPQWDSDGLGMLVLTFVGDGDIGRSKVKLVHVDITGRKRLVANMPARTHGLGRGFIQPPPPPPPPPVCPTPSPTDSPSPTTVKTPSPSPTRRNASTSPTPTPSPSPTDTPSPTTTDSPAPCPTETPTPTPSASAS